MESKNNLTDYIQKTISHWVGRNYGSQEAEDPSWNIKELSSYLARKLGERGENRQKLVPYELSVLFRTDCQENIEVERVRHFIRDFGGEIILEENDGKKRLAYNIKNQEYAIYYYFDIMIPKDSPVKLSGVLNIDDQVLRYLLVQKDTRRR